MKGLLIKNVEDKVTLSALNYYGADFKLDIYNQDTEEYVFQNLQMQESSEPFTALQTTIDEDRSEGIQSIKVQDTTGYNVNDRVSLSTGGIYRIVSIDPVGNEIGLHKGLKNAVDLNTTVDRIGSLGLYFYNLTMTQEGTFLIKAKDSVFGLQRTDSIKVVSPKAAATNFQVLV
jgi:hypothetical protein